MPHEVAEGEFARMRAPLDSVRRNARHHAARAATNGPPILEEGSDTPGAASCNKTIGFPYRKLACNSVSRLCSKAVSKTWPILARAESLSGDQLAGRSNVILPGSLRTVRLSPGD